MRRRKGKQGGHLNGKDEKERKTICRRFGTDM